MWIFVLFDLPTETKEDRKKYTLFRKKLMKDGFSMFQFSAYVRHCPSKENRDVHAKRVRSALPDFGHIGIISLTDRQFEQIEIYAGKRPVESGFKEVHQLELF